MYRKIHAEKYHEWMRRRWQRQVDEARQKREATKKPNRKKSGS